MTVKEHREKARQYSCKRYREHKKELREYFHKWYIEHEDEYRKYLNQYQNNKYKTDPVFRAIQIFNVYKQRDKRKGIMPDNPADYPTKEEYVQMLQQPCVFCGETDWHKIGLDRIDSSLGHIRGNLQPCCGSCNSKKNNMANEEFKQRIADGRIKLKAVKAVKTDADTPAVPAMPSMRSLLV
jgi:5-methylcytosine-specific restriction endonuclease McrA